MKRSSSIFRKDRSLYGVERPWITRDAFKLIYSLVVNTMMEGKGGGSTAAAVSENCAISVFSLLFGQCRANVHVPRPRTHGWNNLFRVVRSNIYFRVRNIWWQEETVGRGKGGGGKCVINSAFNMADALLNLSVSQGWIDWI